MLALGAGSLLAAAAMIANAGPDPDIADSLAVPKICVADQARYAGQPAFPGAEGFGRFATGGRSGRALAVTTLADDGPGSLRACAESSGPRTCIFRVSGTIALDRWISVQNPYLTIAGQTSPGGIALKIGQSVNTPLLIQTTMSSSAFSDCAPDRHPRRLRTSTRCRSVVVRAMSSSITCRRRGPPTRGSTSSATARRSGRAGTRGT